MTLWLIVFGVMAVLVRFGLALLTAGTVDRPAAVLGRAAVESAAALLAFWAIGAPLLFGTGRIVGFDPRLILAQADRTTDESAAAAEAYAAAVATIGGAVVAGAVAGRAKARVGIAASAVLGGVVFPLVGHWVWAREGWLARLNVVDAGGAMAVHLPAAIMALAAAAAVGRRRRPADGGSTASLLILGGVGLTFVGWLPYLMGGVTAHVTDFNQVDAPELAQTAMNTALAAVGGLIAGLGYARFRRPMAAQRPAAFCGCLGGLGGLVAISAGPVSTGNAGALLIGIAAGVGVPAIGAWLDRFVDDPAGLIAVHGVGATWGLVAAAAFAGNQAINRAGQAKLFVAQGLGLAATLAVATVAAAVTVAALRATGSLRDDDPVSTAA